MTDSTLTITLDASNIKTMRSLYTRLSKALYFPAHFGNNLDALFDALCDLEGLPDEVKQVTIHFEHGTSLLLRASAVKRAAALKVLTDACEEANRYDERTLNITGL